MSYDVVTTSYDVVDDFQSADIPSRRRCEIISYDIVDHYESVRFTSCDDFDDIVSTSYDIVDDYESARVPNRRRCETISYDIVDDYESAGSRKPASPKVVFRCIKQRNFVEKLCFMQ